MVIKINWIPKGKLQLVAVCDLGLSENDIDPIQDWCVQHNCGIRTSFDTFKFKTNKEKTMFLLKWGS